MSVILKAENISKQYRLGYVGTGTLKDDFKRWSYKLRGKEDPFLKVGGVNKRAEKADEDYVWALRDINFEVKKGEVLGIIGKNGAGKSTLLKLLSRVTLPTQGTIKTKGKIASLLEVGTGFHPELTGRENIFLNGAILGMTKAEIKTKLDEIISFSGCEKYIDTPVKRYSSGMRVRLAFAVAAHLDPDILVIDEVLAVGDAEFQKKAIGKMQDISKGEGRTVIFVSHNMVSVQQLCTRCLIIEHGEIKAEGETQDIIDLYLNLNEASDSFNRDDAVTENTSAFINDVYLKTIQGEKTNKVQCGKPFDLYFDVKSEVVLDNCIIEIGFDGTRGERLLYLSNRLLEKQIPLQKGESTYVLSIAKIPLLPSKYGVTIRLTDGNGVELDKVQNNFKFQVEEGDFFNTGTLNTPSRGKYLIAHDISKV